MNSFSSQESRDRLADVLESVRNKGVRLWSEHGQLRYKALKGALAKEEIEELRASRGQIVALLEKTPDGETAEPRLEPRRLIGCVPLTFSQLAHWHSYQLSERRGLRMVASAVRLRGRLDVGALQKSVNEIFRRHDALRTRIVVCDGIPVQEIDESGDCEIKVDDLTTLSKNVREIEVQRLIDQLILEPIDVAVGPLSGIRLLRLCDDEHVLIVGLEHIISDGFSLNILFREIFIAYMQALRGRDFSLPAIPIQFADYAVWQRNAEKSWIEKNGAYWNEHLTGCRRLRFPDDKSLPTTNPLGWRTVRFQIGRDLKVKLREWCRLKQTTLVMSVFTAYVGLVLRWCDASDAVFQFQIDGRVSPEIENTIGYFASALPLRVELLEEDSFFDLMKRLTDEYCTAYEHADFSYLEAQVPRPEFTRNTCFNWLPQSPKFGLSVSGGFEDVITCSPVPFENPMQKSLERDTEPMIGFVDTDEEIGGVVVFPLNRFSVETMERFGRNLLVFLRALLRHPDGRVKDVLLLS